MSEPLSLRIIIPAYNEALRLPVYLEQMAAAGPRLGRFSLLEVLIADNGSVDDTAVVARATGARLGLPLRVLSCPIKGKAAALVYAMGDPLTAQGADFLLFADADGATPIEALAAFEPAPAELLVASRYEPGSRIIYLTDPPMIRRIMSAGMRHLTSWLFGLGLTDTQCGFKLLPASAAPLFASVSDRSWVFDVELLARARRAGLILRSIPVTWTEMADSKVSPLRDAIGSLVALLAIRLRLWRDRSSG